MISLPTLRLRAAAAGACALLVALAAPSCAYFNSMYNANRMFADAEKARARGDTPAAETAYRGAIQKANRSLTKHPKSRWTDDALLIIARSQLALHDHAGARDALQKLLDTSTNAGMRSNADIQLGLIEAESGLDEAALARFEKALVKPDAPGDIAALGYLTRARLLSQSGHESEARADLENVRKRAGG